MTDVILVADGALPQLVLAVSRNSDDLGAFGDAEGQAFVVDSALAVCAGDTWDGTVNTPPEPSEPPAMPMRVSKIQFSRLFTTAELVAQNIKRKQIAALQPADYANPANAGLVGLEIVLQKLDLLTEFVELDHADTIAAIDLLQTLGVLSAERAAAVLAGDAPA
jgi:hypothetical protein